MEQLSQAIKQMISISETDLSGLIEQCKTKTYGKREILSSPNVIPEEIFFINKGIIRVVITGIDGVDHSIHFALENQFIADYSCFILEQPSIYSLQAIEKTEVVVMPRSAIEWGYKNLREGEKLGRLIAEFYFIYQDNRIKNLYATTPSQRYNTITEVFPNIHNRVSQHMIASYLGISPVHLSRLKKAEIMKV